MLKWYFLTIKIRKGVNSNQVRYYHSENINFTLIHKYIADLGFRLWYIFCLSNFKDCNHHLILKNLCCNNEQVVLGVLAMV